MFNKILVLVFCLSISFYINAEEWDQQSKQAMINGCTFSLISSTQRDFEQRVVESGNPDAKFPRDLIEPSMAILCGCVVRRAEKEHSYEDAVNNQQIFMPYIQEAFSGGECMPKGPLSNMMGYDQ